MLSGVSSDKGPTLMTSSPLITPTEAPLPNSATLRVTASTCRFWGDTSICFMIDRKLHTEGFRRYILGVTPVREFRRKGWAKKKLTSNVVAAEAYAPPNGGSGAGIVLHTGLLW